MKPVMALGFMSGTSLDGIDAAFLLSDGQKIISHGLRQFFPYTDDFRQKLRECLGQSIRNSFINGVEEQLTKLNAEIALQMIKESNIQPQLIGFHGQTIFHAPPHTLQIGNGNLLADLTNVTVVNDFRSNDCLNGGQGAPLVPIYHQTLVKDLPKPLAVLNIGGVANITAVSINKSLIAFDTGPGNALIDDYVRTTYNLQYDMDGEIAASGNPDKEMVKDWLCDPFFKKSHPKSLDRQHFARLSSSVDNMIARDAVATLTLFTAESIILAVKNLPEMPRQLIVCGGGAKNHTLIKFLQKGLLKTKILKAEDLGWQGDFIEAEAFAFLAIRSFYNLPLSFPLTTGIKIPLTGGKIYKPFLRRMKD